MIEQKYVSKARRIARAIPYVLERRGIDPHFRQWVLVRSDAGLTWLFGVLNLRYVDKLERYVNDNLLHHMSTATRNTPVFVSNSSGLRYGFLLSGRPRLPAQADFPGLKRGVVRLGVSATGEIRASWDRLGHLMVAGQTGSGKSNLLRLLAHQAIADGAMLALSDIDGTSFPMLAGHKSLLAPIAGTPGEAYQVVSKALAEIDRRSALYASVRGYPDKLAEYNELAAKTGDEVLPRLLVILDEYNGTATALGSGKSEFANEVSSLSWRGRKFGVNVIVAAQDFAKAIIGRMRDQTTPVLLRVESETLARNVHCTAAIHFTKPGRAISPRWGKFQSYFLNKADLTASTAGSGILAPNEIGLILWAIENNNGYLSLADIQAHAYAHTPAHARAHARTHARERQMGQGEARRLAKDWELRGWLEKDTSASNKRRVTTELRQIAYKLKSLQSPQMVGDGLQTGLQTPKEGLQTDRTEQTEQTEGD